MVGGDKDVFCPDDADWEEGYDTERHLFHVACTCARADLLVTSVAHRSEVLDDLQMQSGARTVPAALLLPKHAIQGRAQGQLTPRARQLLELKPSAVRRGKRDKVRRKRKK